MRTITTHGGNSAEELTEAENLLRIRETEALTGKQQPHEPVSVAIAEARDVFTSDNAHRWADVARQGRKLGITLDVHANRWDLTTFHSDVLRSVCADAHGVQLTTEHLRENLQRSGCAACA